MGVTVIPSLESRERLTRSVASALPVFVLRDIERDYFSSNRHHAQIFCLGMIPRVEPEGMLFRIML
jgi:hypothetical protein